MGMLGVRVRALAGASVGAGPAVQAAPVLGPGGKPFSGCGHGRVWAEGAEDVEGAAGGAGLCGEPPHRPLPPLPLFLLFFLLLLFFFFFIIYFVVGTF